jgi:hypothetical protein
MTAVVKNTAMIGARKLMLMRRNLFDEPTKRFCTSWGVKKAKISHMGSPIIKTMIKPIPSPGLPLSGGTAMNPQVKKLITKEVSRDRNSRKT